MTKPPDSFGEAIRIARKAAGLSQRELAERLRKRVDECDFTYLCKIETGRMPPPSERLILAIAAELEMDPDDLLVLAGKVPTYVMTLLSRSASARRFIRAAAQSELTDHQWGALGLCLPFPIEARPLPDDLWPDRIQAVVEAARAFVRAADEFPPGEVPEAEAWAGAEDLQRLFEAIEGVVLE